MAELMSESPEMDMWPDERRSSVSEAAIAVGPPRRAGLACAWGVSAQPGRSAGEREGKEGGGMDRVIQG